MTAQPVRNFDRVGEYSTEGGPVADAIAGLSAALDDRLVAIYGFGASFGRGPGAPKARLLVLVRGLNAPTLEDLSVPYAAALKAGVQLRLDTPGDVIAGADCFPVFTLELMDTRVLLHGEDVLADLTVHPAELRVRVEQSLRSLHRDLLQSYLAADESRGLALALRKVLRKSVYLLRALALMHALELPEQPSVEQLVDTVVPHLLGPVDREVWHHLRRFAAFELEARRKEILVLYDEALNSLNRLVTVVDSHSAA